MQCLARAVARSARAATEGYGRRFASTAASATKAYNTRKMRVERMRLTQERHQLQRVLAKLATMEGNLGAMEGRLDKLEGPQGLLGFLLRNRFYVAISGVLIYQFLSDSSSSTPSAQEKVEVLPNNNESD